ncbi:glutathione-disulfide reductase [Amorphus orientalis]|uniref:Glutathione reductase n=1 Tax=Amorphus orientalis TaxID=649198 RepID=A0AAE3VQL8_9HYPH|nr:glutathione-disulfide reductase [Amorphus orientalis]MDQ0315966.1 glutathione reductase (NADPH) [Amorphus orientalis]
MSEFDYDLFVIGGGSGGVRAARIAAQHGARVALAEEYRYGGTCVIRGCVPKKLLVYASHFSEAFEDARGFGWTGQEAARFDWPTLIANKDHEIDRLEKAYLANLERSGVTTIRSRASLESEHRVYLEAEDRAVTAERVLIATGGRPNVDPRLPGVEHVITSNEAFHLERFPERIVVTGGGYIAVEFAGIFRGLGAETTLIYRGDEILRGFDDDLRTALHAEMERKGIKIILNDVFTEIEKTDAGLFGHTRAGHVLAADQIMFAIGRRPNTSGLGLEALGVEQSEDGAIKVDAQSRTNVPSIYAIGDVTNRVNLTPVAIREGHAFADTVYGGKPTTVDHCLVPSAVFSHPEIGTVGLTETEARAAVRVVDIYKTSFRPMLHTLSGREEKTLVKLVVDGETDRVLGAHILGPAAAEMVQLLGILLHKGATKADFDATIAVHPTAAEELVTMRMAAERHVREAAE